MPILVTSVVSVVSVPLYFRVLGDQMYAIWFYVGTLTGAFGFMDLGLGVAVGRFIGVALGRDDHEAVKEYWATGNAIVLPFVLFFALVFVIIGTVWGPEWFRVMGSDASTMRWAILWGGGSLFFAYYGQMWNVLAQAHLDFKYLSILRTWLGLVGTFGTISVALLWKSVAAIMLFTLILGAVQFALLFRRGQSHYKLPLRISDFRKSRFVEMLPYTLKTFGQLISGSVLGSLDRVFLGRLAPAAEFAAFGVSQNIGGRLSGMSVAIMGPIFNNTARGVGGDQTKKPKDIYSDSFSFMFPWYSLVIIGVFFWSVPVTQLWLGAKHGSSVNQTFPWIVSALCLNAIANLSGAQLGGLDRVGTGLFIQTAASALSIVGTVGGWYLGGITGAAIGFLAARTTWMVQDGLVRQWVGIPTVEYLNILPILIRQVTVVGAIWMTFHLLADNVATQSIGAIVSGVLAAGIEIFSAIKSQKQKVFIQTSTLNES